MSKCLTVVALVLLVLAGAMGLRNLTAANAAISPASGLSAHAIWAIGGGPVPSTGGGGNFSPIGGGPVPSTGGGGNFSPIGGGPVPSTGGGGN